MQLNLYTYPQKHVIKRIKLDILNGIYRVYRGQEIGVYIELGQEIIISNEIRNTYTLFLLIMNQTKFRLFPNQKENCRYDLAIYKMVANLFQFHRK